MTAMYQQAGWFDKLSWADLVLMCALPVTASHQERALALRKILRRTKL